MQIAMCKLSFRIEWALICLPHTSVARTYLQIKINCKLSEYKSNNILSDENKGEIIQKPNFQEINYTVMYDEFRSPKAPNIYGKLKV